MKSFQEKANDIHLSQKLNDESYSFSNPVGYFNFLTGTYKYCRHQGWSKTNDQIINPSNPRQVDQNVLLSHYQHPNFQFKLKN